MCGTESVLIHQIDFEMQQSRLETKSVCTRCGTNSPNNFDLLVALQEETQGHQSQGSDRPVSISNTSNFLPGSKEVERHHNLGAWVTNTIIHYCPSPCGFLCTYGSKQRCS